jgi:hypothetical protein
VCFSERHDAFVVAQVNGYAYSTLGAIYRNPHVGPIRWQ